MLNKKIIKDSANWPKTPELNTHNRRTELEHKVALEVDTQKRIDEFKALQEDRAVRKNKTTDKFILITTMLEGILELRASFNSKFTTREGRIINCEEYGVLEEDLLKATMTAEERGDYEKSLKNQIWIIRYSVNDKNYLLLSELDKRLDDPSQKYIAQAINALKKANNMASVGLELLIKQKIAEYPLKIGSEIDETETTIELSDSGFQMKHEKPTKIKNFYENKENIVQHRVEIFRNKVEYVKTMTGKDDEEAESALIETKGNKAMAIRLLNDKKIKEQLPDEDRQMFKKDESKASVKLNNNNQTRNPEIADIIISLAHTYRRVELEEIGKILRDNKNDVQKTKEELDRRTLLEIINGLDQEEYPFVPRGRIYEILKERNALDEEARRTLGEENLKGQKEYERKGEEEKIKIQEKYAYLNKRNLNKTSEKSIIVEKEIMEEIKNKNGYVTQERVRYTAHRK